MRHGKLERMRIELPEAWAQDFSLKAGCSTAHGAPSQGLDNLGLIMLDLMGVDLNLVLFVQAGKHQGYAELTADANAALWTKGLEVHYTPKFQGPSEKTDKTISGLYMTLDGQTFENLTELSLSASFWAHLDVQQILRRSLTLWERRDFGYHSFLGLMTLTTQVSRRSREVLVLVNCRYLRVFDWPLAKKQDRLAAIEVDFQTEPLASTGSYEEYSDCVYLTHKSSGLMGGYRVSILCTEDMAPFWDAVYAVGERRPIVNLVVVAWFAGYLVLVWKTPLYSCTQ